MTNNKQQTAVLGHKTSLVAQTLDSKENKQQTALEWLWEIAYNRELTSEAWKQAKEMEAIGKEMSYDDGYREGYKRAMELIKWTIEQDLTQRV